MSKIREPEWAVTYNPRTAAWGVAAHSIEIHDRAETPHQYRGPRFNDVDAASEAASALNRANLHPSPMS